MAKKQTKQAKQSADINLAQLGADAGLVLLRDSDYAMVFDRLPLFLPRVDVVIGGGLPFGRMIEVAGRNAGGKSTLAFHAARVGTSLGCIVVLVDVEGTADRERLGHLGLDTSKVLVKQPDPEKGIALTVEEIGRTIEDTLAVFKKMYPDTPVIFIWDSVGQTPSKVELEKDYGEQNVGARAKAITQFITKIAPQISETKSMLIAINQIRDDVGGNTMFPTMKVPGGKAWEHFASLRIEIKKKKALDKTINGVKQKIGHIMGVKVNKSKVCRPHQEADAYLISDDGIHYEYNLIEMAIDAKIASKPGQSYEYVDLNGEIHKKTKDEFLRWMAEDFDGKVVREEILNRLVEIEFPEGYPALANKTLGLEGWMDTVHAAGLVTADSLPVGNATQSADDLLSAAQSEMEEAGE